MSGRPRISATSVGSLPHTDAAAAAELVLRYCPDLPAAPQLRSEPMVDQVAAFVADPGLRSLPEEGWAGFRVFLDELARTEPPARPSEVKVQLVGPVTLARAAAGPGDEAEADAGFGEEGFATSTGAVDAAGAMDGVRVDLVEAVDAVERAAAAVLGEVGPAGPGLSVLLVLDEPWLVEARPGELEALGGLIRRLETLAGVGGVSADLTVGVHCCAGAGGAARAVAAGAQVVSVPLASVGSEDAEALAGLVRRGGRVVWGVVPSDGSGPLVCWDTGVAAGVAAGRGGPGGAGVGGAGVGEAAAVGAVERLRAWWDAHPGPDWEGHALVSPDCGLALRSPEEAELILEVVAEVAGRLSGSAAGRRRPRPSRVAS